MNRAQLRTEAKRMKRACSTMTVFPQDVLDVLDALDQAEALLKIGRLGEKSRNSPEPAAEPQAPLPSLETDHG